jgi:hypothetical protein
MIRANRLEPVQNLEFWRCKRQNFTLQAPSNRRFAEPENRNFCGLLIAKIHNLNRLLWPPLLFFLCVSLAAESQAQDNPFDKLTFKVAVFGPSDEIFIWWGHAALIVEDSEGYARIFDWGIFSYPGDSFLKAFALNQVRYRSGVSPARWDIDNYIKEDRDIILYTLDLEASKKEAILQYAEINILPENCWYIYHQFRDNCSTRIRDIVDLGTDGQLSDYFDGTNGRFTLREHMRRFTWYSPFFDWFLGFLLGRDIDRNITMWEEMYLPVEMGRNIINFRYVDSAGNGRGLVSGIEIVNRTKNRKSILLAPRSQWPRSLAVGLSIAVLLLLARLFRRKHPCAGRLLWGISNSLLGLAFGLAGTILFAASRVAERDYMRGNINLLYINPILLAAIPLGICTAMGGKTAVGKYSIPAETCLRFLWLYVFAAGIASALINLLPGLYQQNRSSLALILPAALILLCREKKL